MDIPQILPDFPLNGRGVSNGLQAWTSSGRDENLGLSECMPAEKHVDTELKQPCMVCGWQVATSSMTLSSSCHK